MRHDQLRHLRCLRLLLSQDKSPLGFFLAAGCPLSVKDENGDPLLPDMAGLARIIVDEHADDAADSPFRRLIVELGKAGKKTDNVEDILTFIRSMKEVAFGEKVRGFSETELISLEKLICDSVSSSVCKSLPKGENSYRRFAKWVGVIDRTVPVELFTTNYDLLMEQALEEQCMPFYDGFSGSRYPFFDIHSV